MAGDVLPFASGAFAAQTVRLMATMRSIGEVIERSGRAIDGARTLIERSRALCAVSRRQADR